MPVNPFYLRWYTWRGGKRVMFKVGEVVTLKSGGPGMTVSQSAEESVKCLWFNVKGELKTEAFDPAILMIVETEPIKRVIVNV